VGRAILPSSATGIILGAVCFITGRSSTAGIRAITVTVDATSAEVGEYTYSWVRYEGVTYYGKEAASLLMSN